MPSCVSRSPRSMLGMASHRGRLPIDQRALTGWDLQSVAVGTVEEGCVGEMIAALEARAAAELALDDAVRAVLDAFTKTNRGTPSWPGASCAGPPSSVALRCEARCATRSSSPSHASRAERRSKAFTGSAWKRTAF